MSEQAATGVRRSDWFKRLALTACVATAGVAIGWLAKPGPPAAEDQSVTGFELPRLPELTANAMASQAVDNFVLATGFVDNGIEAFFFLDFLTGDLKAGVVAERGPGFTALFGYNIAADFAAASVKNPKYLMVPGEARNRRQGNNMMGHCLVYVVEATSGQIVAYGVPFNAALYNAGKPQRGSLVPIARAQLRQQYVRDQ
ncbi:MAG: hypothetical protein AAFV43_15895 [Planctomycetota bacterium]